MSFPTDPLQRLADTWRLRSTVCHSPFQPSLGSCRYCRAGTRPEGSSCLARALDYNADDARDVARGLCVFLGKTMTAALGLAPHTSVVLEWMRDGALPRPTAMRAAFTAAKLLVLHFGDTDTARAWFTSANPSLNNRSPLAYLRAAITPAECAHLIAVASRDWR